MADSLIEARNDKDARVLHLGFQSGLKRSLAYALLRGYCPCAQCQGHGAGPRQFIESARTLRSLQSSLLVTTPSRSHGQTGTARGIYTFDFLRGLQ